VGPCSSDGRSWDVVIDTCGFQPEDVAASARAVAAERHVFVSTAGVHRDWPGRPAPSDWRAELQVEGLDREREAAILGR
jgi:hypothetical protein